jgi:hypothetical protein
MAGSRRETVSKATVIGCLVNPANSNAARDIKEAREAAHVLGLERAARSLSRKGKIVKHRGWVSRPGYTGGPPRRMSVYDHVLIDGKVKWGKMRTHLTDEGLALQMKLAEIECTWDIGMEEKRQRQWRREDEQEERERWRRRQQQQQRRRRVRRGRV